MYLYGASGHGKVIKDILEAQGISIDAFVDDNQGISQICGIPVLHYSEGLTPLIVSIGINKARKMVVERLFCQFGTAIHPSVIVSSSAKIGEGTLVAVGASVIPCIKVGKWCTIGARAAVVKNALDDSTVVGIPAKVLKMKDFAFSELGDKPLIINLLQKPLAERSCHAA